MVPAEIVTPSPIVIAPVMTAPGPIHVIADPGDATVACGHPLSDGHVLVDDAIAAQLHGARDDSVPVHQEHSGPDGRGTADLAMVQMGHFAVPDPVGCLRDSTQKPVAFLQFGRILTEAIGGNAVHL